jgi:hypothetical protein
MGLRLTVVEEPTSKSKAISGESMFFAIDIRKDNNF